MDFTDVMFHNDQVAIIRKEDADTLVDQAAYGKLREALEHCHQILGAER